MKIKDTFEKIISEKIINGGGESSSVLTESKSSQYFEDTWQKKMPMLWFR